MKIKQKIFSKFYATVATSSYQGIEDLTIQKVASIITGFACWATRIIIPVIVIFLIYYGLRMILSRGDPTKFNDAKKGLFYAILGIIVIFGTYTIIATVANALGANYSAVIPLKCEPIQDVRTNIQYQGPVNP